MKVLNIKLVKAMKRFNPYLGVLLVVFMLNVSCNEDEGCGYGTIFDCEILQLNFEEPCDSNADGTNDGKVNQSCECIPEKEVATFYECPGFIQNGSFETLTGDPNASVDQDIDLATHWKALWQNGSLADLFNDTTTSYGAGCFSGPTPLSGAYAGMWIENSTTPGRPATYREGMFNELAGTIFQNTGAYTLTLDYANMSVNCGASNAVKVGVYGVYHPLSNPLPANPTGLNTPSNIDLFGAANTVFLGEITITATTPGTWTTTSFSIDSNGLSFPINGINHIMITNSHQPFDSYGKMFLGFDNFCLINASK